MNYDEILARIQKGEKVEDIMNEFNSNVRKAQEAIAVETAKKEKECAKNLKLDEIAASIAQALNKYVAVAGIECEALEAAEVRELLDEFLPLLDMVKDMEVKITHYPLKKHKNTGDIFADFFKAMNI